MTLAETMQGMVTSFDPTKAKGVSAVVQLNASGDDGGDFNLKIADGTCQLAAGQAEKPTVTIDVAAQDWIDIITGKLDPTRAFMAGKLRIRGDLGLMMRFQGMFVR